jgi:hypothetical protein
VQPLREGRKIPSSGKWIIWILPCIDTGAPSPYQLGETDAFHSGLGPKLYLCGCLCVTITPGRGGRYIRLNFPVAFALSIPSFLLSKGRVRAFPKLETSHSVAMDAKDESNNSSAKEPTTMGEIYHTNDYGAETELRRLLSTRHVTMSMQLQCKY